MHLLHFSSISKCQRDTKELSRLRYSRMILKVSVSVHCKSSHLLKQPRTTRRIFLREKRDILSLRILSSSSVLSGWHIFPLTYRRILYLGSVRKGYAERRRKRAVIHRELILHCTMIAIATEISVPIVICSC